MWPLLPEGRLDEVLKVGALTALLTALVVLIHYEGLKLLARHYGPRTSGRPRAPGTGTHRAGFVGLIFALLALRVLEIWCYGIAYFWMGRQPDMGSVLGGDGLGSLFDAIYFSATMYTTLGLGDLSPTGPIRLLTGRESVTGLLLITWSASFTYMEMTRAWQHDGE